MMAANDTHMQQKASTVGDRAQKTIKYDRTESTKCNAGTRHPPFDRNESLLDLNDDCLSEILSYLSDIDLCAINDTCRRLEPLAVEVFRLRYKMKEYTLYYGFTKNVVKKTILKHFGQLIVSLDLGEIGKSESQFLSKYCNSFTEFTSEFGRYHNIHDKSLQLIFKNVSHLTLYEVHVKGDVLERIVCACDNIKLLSLTEVWFDSDRLRENFFDRKYATIERFSCKVTEDLDINKIARFIKKNQQLKELALEGQLDVQLDSDITSSMKKIEHICLKPIHPVISINLNRLNKMKYLELHPFPNCYAYGNAAKIPRELDYLNSKTTKRIEILGISTSEIDDKFCSKICRFVNLRSLMIVNGDGLPIDGNCLEAIAENLKQLEHLYIRVVINIESIYGLIEKSPKLKSLTILNPSTMSRANFINKNAIQIYKDQLSKLVDARKKVNVAFPLIIYSSIPLNDEWIGIEEKKFNSRFIQFKRGKCAMISKHFFSLS